MKRTRTNKSLPPPDGILSADFHLRVDTPICRTDDFERTQWSKVSLIEQLSSKYECPVLHAGDLFHHWKPSPYLLSKTMEYLPYDFRTVYGNHDMPQHNLDLANRSGIYVLKTSSSLTVLPGVHFDNKPDGSASLEIKGRKILVWHVMTYQAKLPFPGCTAPKANKLLKKYPEYDLILTGDNHTPFVEYYGRKGANYQVLVNPGSITRQTAAQIEHKPRVYFYYADSNTVEPYFLPIESDAVSREHIERSSGRDDRIRAFIASVDGEWSAGLDFAGNLQRFFAENKIRKSVKHIVQRAIDSETD